MVKAVKIDVVCLGNLRRTSFLMDILIQSWWNLPQRDIWEAAEDVFFLCLCLLIDWCRTRTVHRVVGAAGWRVCSFSWADRRSSVQPMSKVRTSDHAQTIGTILTSQFRVCTAVRAALWVHLLRDFCRTELNVCFTFRLTAFFSSCRHKGR